MADLFLHTIRMSRHFRRAKDILAPEIAAMRGNIVFTYCDRGAVALSLDANDRFFRLIRPEIRNPFADKGRIGAIMEAHGVDELFPVSCLSVAAARAQPDVALWFAKNRHGSGGKGMRCLTVGELEHYTLPPHHVLQAGVSDIALIEGRKFTTRLYFLVWNRALYLYRDGFNIVHGVAYDPASTDYAVQISHAGYRDAEGPVRMHVLSDHPDFETIWPLMLRRSRQLAQALGALRDGSSSSEYLLMGVDCILRDCGDAGYDLKMIEINAIPNFYHTREIDERVNLPFFCASLREMFGLKASGLYRLI